MRLAVLYGSQTGTAQDVAEQFYRKAVRWRMNATLSALNDFPVTSLLANHAAIFVCSTTGQGEEPDNMRTFWKMLLRRNLPVDLFGELRFAVLGLGDSSYPKFNFVAKRLHRRLCQLGAKPLCEPALADDQHELGPEGVIDPWFASLWSNIVSLVPPAPGAIPLSEDELLPSKYDVTILPASENIVRSSGEEDEVDKDVPFFAPVVSNERVTPTSHWQDVRLISFGLSDGEGHVKGWLPGDVVYVQPSNLAEDVEELLELLNLDPNQELLLSSREGELPLPPSWIVKKRSTLRDCAERLWDLRALPRRYFFELLSQVTPSEMERERLKELLDPANQQDLWNYCHRPRRTSLETLGDFPIAAKALPLTYLFDVFAPIKPRSFSIASSSSWSPDKLQILVAVVEYKTRMKEARKGLCSTFLGRCEVGGGVRVPIWTRKGTFTFPKDEKPLLMIGPGTGIAPFRCFVQEFLHSKALLNGKGDDNKQEENESGRHLVFFGCRNQKADFFFEKEWEEAEKLGVLKLVTAFSRDQDFKVYVQHKLLEHPELVWSVINDQSGRIFFAGNAKQMPKDVCDALKQIFQENGGLTEEDADEYLAKMESSGRFQQETWS